MAINMDKVIEHNLKNNVYFNRFNDANYKDVAKVLSFIRCYEMLTAEQVEDFIGELFSEDNIFETADDTGISVYDLSKMYADLHCMGIKPTFREFVLLLFDIKTLPFKREFE